jgi:mRNA interferase YafQ
MKALRLSGRFAKDLRLMTTRRGWPRERLERIVDMLRAGQRLPPANRDHPLKGEWQGYRDCHIMNDWVLIYRDADDTIELVRTGTHSDLFG